jgi:hypothetical protein
MLFSFNAFSEENVPTDTTISTPEIEEVENGANQPSLTPKTEQKKTAEAEDTPTQDNVPVEKSLKSEGSANVLTTELLRNESPEDATERLLSTSLSFGASIGFAHLEDTGNRTETYMAHALWHPAYFLGGEQQNVYCATKYMDLNADALGAASGSAIKRAKGLIHTYKALRSSQLKGFANDDQSTLDRAGGFYGDKTNDEGMPTGDNSGSSDRTQYAKLMKQVQDYAAELDYLLDETNTVDARNAVEEALAIEIAAKHSIDWNVALPGKCYDVYSLALGLGLTLNEIGSDDEQTQRMFLLGGYTFHHHLGLLVGWAPPVDGKGYALGLFLSTQFDVIRALGKAFN